MLWLICISMLIVCLKSVKSDECNKTDVIVGRLGEDLIINFPVSGLREKLQSTIYANITELFLNDNIQLKKLNDNMTVSMIYNIIYKNGNPTYLTGNLTEIVMTNNNVVIKKTKLQKEDAGIYWIYFKTFCLGQKAVIITGKPIIKGRSPPNLVLKPEDNYTSIIQLECHSDMGDYPLSMYTVWYKNGMRMTDVDPNLSQINVTVDHNGGQFTCLATDYLPCYQRLQTTVKHYDVMNIEECNNVSESEIYTVRPEWASIDVKLEPDQRQIIVNKNEDLKVRCSAKCHPQCDVRWVKDYQDLVSNGLVNLPENMFENDLEMKNITCSYEGVYVCLVNNTHGEVEKSFTLRVRGAETKELNSVFIAVKVVFGVVIVIIFIIVFVFILAVVVVIIYKKYEEPKLVPHRNVLIEESSGDGIYDSVLEEELLPVISTDNNSINGEPGTSTDNNSINGEPGTSTDNISMNGEPGISTDMNPEIHTYNVLDFNSSNGNGNPDPEIGYTRLFNNKKRQH